MEATPSVESDDLIEYFLEDLEYQGRSERTRQAYRRVLRAFESFHSERNEAGDLGTVSYRDCLSWIHTLRDDKSESTIATYASYLHRFYSYLNRVGVLEENPMTVVLEEMNESIETNPERRDISVDEIREFVSGINHPLDQAIIVTLVKTGIRAGEICNLDLRDIHLESDYEFIDRIQCHRQQLSGRPDSIYVDSEIVRDKKVNGEMREASNKRQRSTVIPVDPELKSTLERWLVMRPDTGSPADPVFVSTRRKWGQRVSGTMVHHIVQKHAKSMDWYAVGGGATNNVTPHYFRHFFTTHLRDRTGDRGVVKYLRGDVGDDIIDTYTHNWGDRVREVYLQNIFKVLT